MSRQRRRPGKFVGALLSAEDYEKLSHLYASSLEPSLAAFIRKKVFEKPVRTIYRDRAYDDFIEAAIQLKNALTNHAVHIDSQTWLMEEISRIKELLIKIEEYVSNSKKHKRSS